jgi:hypothetical protein
MNQTIGETVEISGLVPLIEDEEELPYLDLTLRCLGRTFRAAILVSEECWTVNVRDERGRSCPGSGDLYDTQAEAILAASLMVISLSRNRFP